MTIHRSILPVLATTFLLPGMATGRDGDRPRIETVSAEDGNLKSQPAEPNPNVTDQAGLRKVRECYNRSCRMREVGESFRPVNWEALRPAVEDLTDTYGERYPRGPEFLRRIEEARRLLDDGASANTAVSEEDVSRFERACRDASTLQREALLANPLLNFDELLLVRRKDNQLGLPRNWQSNSSVPKTGYDNEIARMSISKPESGLKPVFRPGHGEFVGDVDLHFDAGRMLFSMPSGNGKGPWHVHEINLDGSGLRVVTKEIDPAANNYDACYLPDGRIVFTSTAGMVAVPCVRGNSPVATLFRTNADGTGPRQLCFDQEHSWCPAVMNDGRILGTAPVTPGGSAMVRIPANTPIAIQPLDSEGKALQLMRSWMTAMPGETLSCVGCHEEQNETPPAAPISDLKRPPSEITPWYGPRRNYEFQRELQPVLDRYCVGCHDGEMNEPDLRGTVMLTGWSSAHPGNTGAGTGGKFSIAYANVEENHEHLPKTDMEPVRPLMPQPEPPRPPVPAMKGWPFKAAPAKKPISVDLGNGTVMEMVHVPPGEFPIGSIAGYPDEFPMTRVRIEQGFWMSKFEITNRQFGEFDPDHDSREEDRHGYQFGIPGYAVNGPDLPAVRLSWNQANAFCAWLSGKTGRPVSLPTEAQWEWACRAGTDTPFHYGGLDTDFSKHANLGDATLADFSGNPYQIDRVKARYNNPDNPHDNWIPQDARFNDGGFVSETVGKYQPNAWGLHDMHGNVAEWTASIYKPYPYTGPVAGESGKRVVRGGSWYDRPKRCTSSYRFGYREYQGVFNVGFRVVMVDDRGGAARPTRPAEAGRRGSRTEDPPRLEFAADLVTPVMAEGAPMPGKRVRQVAPEYEGTEVYHSLYLPVDWKAGGKHPVIVEYTGNKFPPGKGSGEVKDANLGYGMSGGREFIWVVMPYIEKGRKKNAVQWWGDKEATVDYCKVNLPRICKQFGGDPENVFVCGFSRGAIGSSYIGLADDEIAAFWKGMFTHDHFDGHRKWGYPEDDRASALKRLSRLKGRPVLVCGQQASTVRDQFLKDHLELADFTFLDVPVTKIFKIPEGPYIHPHTDLWMHRESEYRRKARAWLHRVRHRETKEEKPATGSPG